MSNGLKTAAAYLRSTKLQQVRGDFLRFEEPETREGPIVGACALGAIAAERWPGIRRVSTARLKEILTHDEMCWISNLNDAHGKTFAEIADMIDPACEADAVISRMQNE